MKIQKVGLRTVIIYVVIQPLQPHRDAARDARYSDIENTAVSYNSRLISIDKLLRFFHFIIIIIIIII